MPVQLSTIARNTFIEAIRQPIFFVIVALCGLFQLFNTWTAGFSLGYSDSAEVSGDNKMLLDIGLATVFVCGVILAAFIATAVVSREIENKTVLTVVSKPVARPTVILGKYLGVAGAMILAVIPMLLFLMMGLRHGVMSTAADTLDGPVWIFTTVAILLSFGVAVWCNFFYGWYFTQTAMVLIAPAMVLAYIFVLLVGKKWEWQPITTDFKGQITFACIGLTLALLKGEIGETYNIGGKCEMKNIDVVHAIIAAVNAERPELNRDPKELITYVKDRPGHDRRYAIDCSKIGRELGWEPQETFASGMRKTVRWYLDNAEWINEIERKYQLQRLGHG